MFNWPLQWGQGQIQSSYDEKQLKVVIKVKTSEHLKNIASALYTRRIILIKIPNIDEFWLLSKKNKNIRRILATVETENKYS